MVTICTAILTFNNSTLCSHSVIMCFVWIWQQTAIISLYNINWLVCITETEYVYCAVRTECLNTSRVTWLGHLSADILRLGLHLLCRTSSREIYGAQSGTGISSVLAAPFFPTTVNQCCTPSLSGSYTLYTDNWAKPKKPRTKRYSSNNCRALDRPVFTFSI